MKNKTTKSKAIDLIDDYVKKFKEVKSNATYENRYKASYEEAYYGAEMVIENLFGEKEKNNFRKEVSSIGFVLGNTIDQSVEVKEYIEHIDSCISQLNIYRQRIINFWEDDEEMKIKPAIKLDKIFIVHGHNEEMKQSVARLIDRIGIEPIVLHEKPNKGRTIIEKFEDHSNVGGAIILLTGDDKFETNGGTKYRARQNVIFEMGFFIGKLGRDKVVVLYQTDEKVEMLSDYQGVLYVPYDKKGSWKFEMCNELKEMGYAIDLNKI